MILTICVNIIIHLILGDFFSSSNYFMCVFSYFYESFEPIIINDEICPIFQSEISRQNDILKPNAFEIDVNATGDCAK